MSKKLIVGLGNPGAKYQRTRHNVGFDLLAELARQYGTGSPRARFQGEVVEARIGMSSVLLLAPHTYMNRSGSSLRAAFDFYKLEVDDLLVACDDFNLPLAKLRFRAKGSSGGQKGLEDVIRHLGTNAFSRLRIGIGAPPENWKVPDYVLSRFTEDEVSVMQDSVKQAAKAAASWVEHGIDYCMNHYN